MANEPNYTKTEVSCSVCQGKLQIHELQAVGRDTDFVPHGDRGHLIRIETDNG